MDQFYDRERYGLDLLDGTVEIAEMWHGIKCGDDDQNRSTGARFIHRKQVLFAPKKRVIAEMRSSMTQWKCVKFSNPSIQLKIAF